MTTDQTTAPTESGQPLGEVLARARRIRDRRQKDTATLRSLVPVALDLGAAEAEVARSTGLDRMTVRRIRGKQ